MTRQTHPRVMTLIHPKAVIIGVNDAKTRHIGKKDPIRLCATLTGKLLTTAYKLKIIRFKLDEDPTLEWILIQFEADDL